MSDKKFNVGDKVRYIGKDHLDYPEYYPAISTVGVITGTLDNDPDCYVQWPKNSTSGDDEHWCGKDDIELVEDVDMTNEEIWKMLEPKMVKNGLKSTESTIRLPAQWCYGDPLDIVKSYEENMVHNAIAIAYRSGYERAMKGRPFKIGEKKKGGHWEWIKPDEIVLNGTKVRCGRKVGPSGNNVWIDWKIGYEGEVTSEKDWGSRNTFWVDHFCLDSCRDCFQKWVEDDE